MAPERDSEVIKLRVDGVPVPQGSVSAFAVRKAGKPTGRVTYTGDNPKTKHWRQAILDQARSVYPDGFYASPEAELGPKSVVVVFVLPRPGGHFGRGRAAAEVRKGAPARPGARPDVDKLARAVLDALTDAGAWRDDGQVVDLAVHKVYAGDGERPGALIHIEEAKGG
jgi:Endodeoxyribonuclease RusA